MASRSPIDAELLTVLACQKCKGELTLAEDEKGLVCKSCLIVYPVREGVPVMLAEEAYPLQQKRMAGSETAATTAAEKVFFSIVEGKNKGERIELERGVCRAVGRSIEDVEKTRVFSMDSVITLDESSKKIVMQYLAKHFQKSSTRAARKDAQQETIGNFIRGPDFQIYDASVSRLHAMMFYDESGSVGILDLVSRNGTFVNGGEIESKILKKGDLITLGNTKIRFEG